MLRVKLAKSGGGDDAIVVMCDKRQGRMYEVQHLVTGEGRDAHVVRMRFYADKDLEIRRRLQDVPTHRTSRALSH